MAALRRTTCAPYRPFFLLAALDAVLGAVVWLPWSAATRQATSTGLSPADWHRYELLFGMVPALFAGFLLTAVPRWTRRPPVAAATLWLLTGCWVVGRVTFLVVSPTAGLPVSAVFLLALLSVCSARIVAARDRRDYPVMLLLLGFLASAALTTTRPASPVAERLAVASLLGLLLTFGGRVIPPLTTAYTAGRDRPAAVARVRLVERAAATAAALALVAWMVLERGPVVAVLGGAAALAQAGRLVQWRGWRCLTVPSVLALHLGYGWLVVGFVLLGWHAVTPGGLTEGAVVHVWTVGGLGTMALGVMASMIRRHSGHAFATSRLATGAFVAITLGAAARLLAELVPGAARALTAWAAVGWTLAFVLFLAAFSPLLVRPAPTDRGPTPTALATSP
jgi:uncharacterized protein involved in response to NO